MLILPLNDYSIESKNGQKRFVEGTCRVSSLDLFCCVIHTIKCMMNKQVRIRLTDNVLTLVFRYLLDWQNSQHIYSVLHEHFDIIRTRLGVKRLDESYNISPSYPQTLNPRQRQFAQSTENLHLDSVKSNVTFMDFNPLTSKRSVDATNVNLKIDYVSRIKNNTIREERPLLTLVFSRRWSIVWSSTGRCYSQILLFSWNRLLSIIWWHSDLNYNTAQHRP